MKSLINSFDNAVTETLLGLCYAFPQLEYQPAHKVVLIPNLEDRENKASVICGGGAGHEPFAAGFVGNGMLTAAVSGCIFSAPTSQNISYAIDRVSLHSKAGILMVIPNYTGDCLNFGIAVEKAKQAGLKITELIVDEDCSIPSSEQGVAGKRGLPGILFVLKVTGALAERGLPLEEIHTIAQNVVKNMATYAVGLIACAIPDSIRKCPPKKLSSLTPEIIELLTNNSTETALQREVASTIPLDEDEIYRIGQPVMFELAEDEIECGMGIHGEAGYEKTKLKSSYEVVSFMLKPICDSLSLHSGDEVAAIINNFGALSQLEQGIVVHDLIHQLKNMNIRPVRIYSGVLMTSLNSAGIHITLLKLPESYKDTFINCLDEPTNAPRWPGCAYSIPSKIIQNIQSVQSISECQVTQSIELAGLKIDVQYQNILKQCLKSACESIIEKESFINDLDRGCGDGDCGSTLTRLANDILQNINNYYFSHPSSVLSKLAHTAEEQMGGTSGALYCLFFTSAAAELISAQQGEYWLNIWARALRSGLHCLMKYGKANPGDRSMIDVINAVCKTYENILHKEFLEICSAIKAAAWQACEDTKTMKPKVGRASYVKQTQYLQNVDAGAYGAATGIGAVIDVIKNAKI